MSIGNVYRALPIFMLLRKLIQLLLFNLVHAIDAIYVSKIKMIDQKTLLSISIGLRSSHNVAHYIN